MSAGKSAGKDLVTETPGEEESVAFDPELAILEPVTDENFLEVLGFVTGRWKELMKDLAAQSTRTRANSSEPLKVKTGTVVYKNTCPEVERENFIPWNGVIQQKEERPRVLQTRVILLKKPAVSVSAPTISCENLPSTTEDDKKYDESLIIQTDSINLGESGSVMTPALPVASSPNAGIEDDVLDSCQDLNEDANNISVQEALEIKPAAPEVREYSEFAQDFYNADLDFNLNEWQEVKTKKKPKEEARNELVSQNEAPKEVAQSSSNLRSREMKVGPRGKAHRSKSNYRFPFKSGDAKENMTGRNESATRKGTKPAKKGVLTNKN